MTLRFIGTYSRGERKLRLLRLAWGRVEGDPGHTHLLSLALWPRLWHRSVEAYGWSLTVLGLRVYWQSANGGVFVP